MLGLKTQEIRNQINCHNSSWILLRVVGWNYTGLFLPPLQSPRPKYYPWCHLQYIYLSVYCRTQALFWLYYCKRTNTTWDILAVTQHSYYIWDKKFLLMGTDGSWWGEESESRALWSLYVGLKFILGLQWLWFYCHLMASMKWIEGISSAYLLMGRDGFYNTSCWNVWGSIQDGISRITQPSPINIL